MNYTPEDYVEFYNDHVSRKNAQHGWMAVIALLCVIGGSVLLIGCDGQAAEATHESVMNSQARKEELPPEGRVNSRLLSLPVQGTWIEQSGNDGLGKQMKPIRRYTTAADLTRRK